MLGMSNPTCAKVVFFMIYIILLRQQDLEAIVRLHQRSQNQIQKLQDQVNQLEMENRTKDERIVELECLQDPFSPNGDAICNSL